MKTAFETRIETLQALIRSIQARKPSFAYASPLALSEIEAFESHYEVALPQDYRLFLTCIGNGGPGPGMTGLSKFQPNHPWYQKNWNRPFLHPVEALRQAEITVRAQHTEKLSTEGLTPVEIEAWLHDHAAVLAEESEARADSESEAGYIELGDYGCGIFDFLVVIGSERGHIWWSDDCGYCLPALSPDLTQDWTEKKLSHEELSKRLWCSDYTYRISFLDYIEKYLHSVNKYLYT
jgi:hypothetical protein